MSCAWCNVSSHDITVAVAMAVANGDSANCSIDGSFGSLVQGDRQRWPAPYHFLDSGIARLLQDVVGAASLLDVGAGSGQYGAFFESRKWRRDGGRLSVPVPKWRGIDGMPGIEEFTLRRGPPGSFVRHANICDPSLSLSPADWVMSLEVGEHLPLSCLQTYVRLLSTTARRGLIVSWARPGQGGHCHVSTRDEAWVRASFGAHGWTPDDELTARARSAAQLEWLRRNTFVLARAGAGAAVLP